MLKRYYDRNTQLFLTLGGSRKIHTIHRALWLPGVRTRAEALDSVHGLLAAEIARLDSPQPRLLDLGCGVGGTLFSLADKLPPGWRGDGVTLSSVQVALARQSARQLRLDDHIQFIEADFLHLPELPPIDAAYAIESFVLNADSAGFFRSVAQALRPGGRLILVDDFLSSQGNAPRLSGREKRWLDTFRKGWHAAGLDTVPHAEARARAAGLSLLQDVDLTGAIRLDTWRDRTVQAAVFAGRLLRLSGPYWDSLYGGDALHRCLRHGLTGYHLLVFEKQAAGLL